MEKIGIEDIFSDIFDIESAEFNPKPDPESYHKLVRDLGVNPKKSIMVEDIARNLVPASDMGMKTVWIPTGHRWSAEGAGPQHIDHTVPDLTEWLKSLGKH